MGYNIDESYGKLEFQMSKDSENCVPPNVKSKIKHLSSLGNNRYAYDGEM
jgi:hypothetical protein